MSSQVSSLPCYSKALRLTAYILLFIHLFLPVSVAFSSIAKAVEQESLSVDADMMSTMNGIQELMQDNGASSQTVSLPTSSDKKSSGASLGVLDFTVRDRSDFSAHSFSGEEGIPLSLHDNTVRQDDILSALPTLGLPETVDENRVSPETQVAQGASQAGQLLSSGDAVDASIGYARSLGESLMNQQITNWLNQYGKARVQLGSDKTGDVDILLPLIDKANSLVFSQVGIRANEDRNTTNLGLGYRQYKADWMWGVNSFYDYDITGGNSRVGVGSELWFDYLKFTGNGYFRLTDWHQSDLHAMRDYDERPANGFDLRVEGYLPSYPQLGAYAKYEQYFGKGISLSDSGVSASDLKDNPSRSTLGGSYTPFPLMTLKGENSRGDSNDSRLGLELTYRFGVPLNQQLDPEYVDLMRNLAGNRYDFVDRNYNIVMQYSKQELLTISLPDSMTAEAAALLPVTATINKSKYGLKSIAWSAPELIAQGGQIQITSPTTINLTLPAYIFQARANEPQSYRVSAVGTDNDGNMSNTAEMWVNVKPSQETITSLALSPNTVLVANNSDTYTATALIQNEKRELLADKEVTFTVSGFSDNEKVLLTGGNGDSGQTVTVKTGTQGQALITIKSKVAGNGVLKATMKNGNFRNTALRFVADASTAQITNLVLTNDKALANGIAANMAVATVQDQFGNVVEGFDLESSATNDAVVVTPSQVTNALGQVTTSFTNMKAGSSVLTVKGNSTETQKTVTAQFIADISTAKIDSVAVNKNHAVANGQDRNTVMVTVVDETGNVLENAPVAITVPSPGKYSTLPANGLTNSQGQLVINYTSTKAGPENYPVSINRSQKKAELTFIGDVMTARVVSVELDGTLTEKIANDINTFKFTAKVEDAKGNPVKDVLVAWSKNAGASLLPMLPGTITNSNGLASVELISGTTVDFNIQVSAQVGASEKMNANKKVSFIADESTATITGEQLTVVTNEQLANGEAKNQLKAVVTDVKGNPVPNVEVMFTTNNGGLPDKLTVTTSKSGEALFDVTNTKAVVTTVTATINGASFSKDVTFIADKGTATITDKQLTVVTNKQLANGEAKNQLKAVIKDAKGNPVENVEVMFTVGDGGLPEKQMVATNKSGEALFDVTNTKAGTTTVTARINGTDVSKDVSFKADEGTATITEANLTVVTNNQLANGVAKNQLKAVVTDAKGNVVPNVDVVFSAGNGGLPATQTVKTTASGEALFDVTNTKAGTTTVTARINGTDVSKDVSFEQGAPDLNKGSLTISKQRVIANKSDKATLTLNVVDANDNGVPNLTNITFVIEDSQGNIVTSGITISDVKPGINIGIYEAEISGDNVGSYTVKAKLNGDYFSSLKDSFSLFNYTFNMSDAEKSILVNGAYQYYVRAIASDTNDTNDAIDLINEITWTSNNSGIATISNTGLAKGNTEGSVIIRAAGIYNGFQVNVNSKLNIKEQKKSPLYGQPASGDKVQDYIIQPPSYSVAMRCGYIVDAMGTLENITGGTGGNLVIIQNLNNVKSIDITTGKWNEDNPNTNVTKLVFNMKDGSASQSCGIETEWVDKSTIKVDTFTIPSDQTLQGYKVSGGRYIHSLQFITMP